MSQEDVEISRSFFDAYNRGDLEATLDLIAPEFEFLPSGLFVDTDRTYYGREGWTEFWHTFREAWASITVNVERIDDLGDQLLVLATFMGGAMEAVSRSRGKPHGSRRTVMMGWSLRVGHS